MTDWKERAERAEVELARLRALLTRAVDHVSYGSRRSYDGVGGYKMREAASQLLLEIMAALAALYRAAPPAQPAEQQAQTVCKRTLIEIDARLRECSIVGASAADAYDTFYQHMVETALAAQPAEPSMRPLPDHDNHHNALKCPYCNPRGLKFAEPAAAQPANPEPVASYWLIECKNGFTGWYTGRRLDCRFFDTDHRKACKFASKELAENEINERGHSCMTATEHVDIAAAQPAPAAVPPGYALVPIEPTPEMLDAGDVARHSVVTQARTSVIYRAMIAAAGDKP